MKRLLVILLCLLLAFPPAMAENAAADLQARFGGQASLESGGLYYAVKKRTSTLLFAAHEGDALLLAYILVVDDELDRIGAISIPPETIVSAMDGKTLAQIYSAHLPPGNDQISQPEADSISLLNAVNALLPEALVENRLVLDIRGLDLLDGGSNAGTAPSRADWARQRLKDIYRSAEGMSSSDQMDMLDALSGYLATDVKTGAMMKIADKAGRYTVLPTQPLPGAMQPAQQGDAGEAFIPDAQALTALAIEYFYEEDPWQ